LNAEFDEFMPEPGIDFSGNTIEHSPELTFTTLARYDRPFETFTGFVQADARYQSRVYFGAENEETQSQDSYWLAGARLGLTSPDERYEAALWVKNLFDEEYAMEGSSNAALGFNTAVVGDRRTFGITLTGRF
ncbi:MAG: TonB-dependent receptor, partial [Hyphomonadaceae bacterium]|nr:TonB-dependent receptor [Hyphomonadaceae bacterium]